LILKKTSKEQPQ